MKMEVFYDGATFTLSYLLWDESSKDAVLIDPVLNYDQASSKTSTFGADKIIKFVLENNLKLQWIFETHAHADHLTGAQYFKEKLPGLKIAISEKISIVQETFKPIYNLQNLKTDGSQFDYLLKDNEEIKISENLKIKTINTPGHTPACTSFLVNDEALFTGDLIFMEDYGTGRCDFPAGDATDMYNSITQKVYTLPDEVKIYPGHDYQPAGRELKWESSVGIQKKNNLHLKEGTTKEEFIKFRQDRDATLNAPKLLLPSVQYNIVTGKIEPESNGKKYLKLPLT